jgi:hypothetical protein
VIQKLPPSGATTGNQSVPRCGVANASGRYGAGSGVKPAIPPGNALILSPLIHQHKRVQRVTTVKEWRPTLLLVVVCIVVVALMALALAIMSDDLLFGWLTIGASAVGLLLLIVDELGQCGRREAERDNAGTVLLSARHADISQRGISDESAADERSIRAAPACDEGVLRPDVWPPEHPTQAAPDDGDMRVEQEAVSDAGAASRYLAVNPTDREQRGDRLSIRSVCPIAKAVRIPPRIRV